MSVLQMFLQIHITVFNNRLAKTYRDFYNLNAEILSYREPRIANYHRSSRPVARKIGR